MYFMVLVAMVAGEICWACNKRVLITYSYKVPDKLYSSSLLCSPKMQQAGLRPLFPMDDLAVMGAVEVVPSFFRIAVSFRAAVDC
jgi:lipid A disaccharide synthetase